MPWLTSCCCGFSVRSGTKAIAVLSLMYSVFGLLAVGTFNYGKEILYREHIEQSRRPTGFQEIRKPPEIFMEVPPDDHLIQKQLEIEKFKKMEELMTLYAVSVSITFLVSLALLLGVRMEKKWLLLPWIIWTALNLVISQAVVLYAPDRTTSTIPDIFTTAIVVYCMMCVISYYQKLAENLPGTRPSSRSSHGSSYTNNLDQHIGGLGGATRCVTASFPNRGQTEDIMVALPDSPPPYPSEDPPVYDPPPPYPGMPTDEKMAVFSEESEIETTTNTIHAITTPATNLNTTTNPATNEHTTNSNQEIRNQPTTVEPQNNSANEESTNQMNVDNNESVEARAVDNTNGNEATATSNVENVKMSDQSKI